VLVDRPSTHAGSVEPAQEGRNLTHRNVAQAHVTERLHDPPRTSPVASPVAQYHG
jgi:hypothetical protein